jgi:hypothetical protein
MSDEIAVLNLSKRLKPEDVLAMVDACSRQQAEDVCPLWNVVYRPLNLYIDVRGLPPTTTDIIPIVDEPGDPGVLGFHSIGIAPFGRVFVNPILDNGGCVLAGEDPQQLSVASCLSHEGAIELPVDPSCDQYAVDANGNEWDLEAGDMVQRNQYIKIAKMPWGDVRVSVSDFVLPSFFRVKGSGPFNFMNTDAFGQEEKNSVPQISTPFTVAPGGYAMKNGQAIYARRSDGTDILPPAWWLAMRPPGARRMIRKSSKVPRRTAFK